MCFGSVFPRHVYAIKTDNQERCSVFFSALGSENGKLEENFIIMTLISIVYRKTITRENIYIIDKIQGPF